jgi:hypothetical protein
MKTLERVMQVMTHVNIGCALGMVAWVAWSGMQIVGGHYAQPQLRQLRPGSAAAPSHHQGLTPLPACCLAIDPHGAAHRHVQEGQPAQPAALRGTRI